jgi:hypothetical protein
MGACTLVKFDSQGSIGPAATLMNNVNYFNPKAIDELTKLLKVNFQRVAHVKPKGRKEFCAFIEERSKAGQSITPVEVIRTRFFQDLQSKKIEPDLHAQVLEHIIPNVLKVVQENIPSPAMEAEDLREMTNWYAYHLECTMPKEQIIKHSESQRTQDDAKINEERGNIGKELYADFTAKRLTESDLDKILEASRIAVGILQQSGNPATAMKFTGKYLTLFSMRENDPAVLGNDVLGLIDTMFRSKFFPKTTQELVPVEEEKTA